MSTLTDSRIPRRAGPLLLTLIWASLLGLSAPSGALHAQQPKLALKLVDVRLFNLLNENGAITRQQTDANGGSVDITINGNAYGFCPGGSETLRFEWRFDSNVSQLFGGSGVAASLEAGQASVRSPCTTSYASRATAQLAASNGSVNPFADLDGTEQDGGAFNQSIRGRIWAHPSSGATSARLAVELVDRPLAGTARFAWYEIYLSTSAGDVRYVYLYEAGGAQAPPPPPTSFANLAGDWESDYSGAWKPTTIRQEGGSLWFTNEFNDTSPGGFDSGSRVKASTWGGLGATFEANTIKWDNGTTWRRRGSAPPVGGTGGGGYGPRMFWQALGSGDCSGRDVGSSDGFSPDPGQARAGYTAVCWDGRNYTHPSGRVFCTYKSASSEQCTGGAAPGVMYRASSR